MTRPGIGRGTISLILAVMFVLLGVAAAGVWYVANRPPSDREIHAMLSRVLAEHRALRDRAAPGWEWDDLEARATQETESVMRHLERDASATEPAKQQLLWAVRDYMVPMLQNARTMPTDDEFQFEEQLRNAAHFLR